MKLLEMLRKGFGYVLMSMGVSSPDATRKKPAAASPSKPDART
jgi:hypothetical protein